MKEIVKIWELLLKQRQNQEAPKLKILPESSTAQEEVMFLVGAVVQTSPKELLHSCKELHRAVALLDAAPTMPWQNCFEILRKCFQK